tara:strand:+ start:5066 stop:5323 length:258 start_codon:yes stop_codon:yes gene_type:complete
MKKNIIESTSNKLHHLAALYIAGEIKYLKPSPNIKNKTYIALVKECKNLKEALENQDVESIEHSLKIKEKLAKDFYNLTCIKWRL